MNENSMNNQENGSVQNTDNTNQNVQPTENVQPTVSESIQPTENVQPTVSESIQPTENVQPTASESIQPTENVQPVNIGGAQETSSPQNSGGKKNNKVLIIALVVILIGLGVFAFIFIKNNLLNSPEKIFKTSIDTITHMASDTLDNYNINSKLFDFNLKVDTNLEGMDTFKNYTYGVKLGADSKKSAFEAKVYMLDASKKEYSFVSYLKNNKLYQEFSSYDKLIDLGETEGNEFEELFEFVENYNKDDLKYLVNKSSDLLKDNLDSKKFSKEDAKIKVNGNEVSATKNIYKADGEEINRLTKAVLNGLYKDDKAMKILDKMYGISKDRLKEIIDEEDTSEDTNIIFGIYMIGDKFAGFDVNQNDELLLSYYTENENFDLDFSGGVILKGIKNGDQTDVTVSVDGSEIAKLNVRKFEENRIDFDYDIVMDSSSSSNVTGNVLYERTVTGNNSNGSLAVNLKSGKDYVKLKVNSNETEGAKIADIDESKAVKLTDEQLEDVVNDFVISLEKTPVGQLLGLYSFSDEDFVL